MSHLKYVFLEQQNAIIQSTFLCATLIHSGEIHREVLDALIFEILHCLFHHFTCLLPLDCPLLKFALNKSNSQLTGLRQRTALNIPDLSPYYCH